MQEETQVNSQEQVKPVEPKATEKKDYLAPALVFIALFFSFFVLITMQKLARKAVGLDEQYGTPQFPMETVPNVEPKGQTSPAETVGSGKTLMEDQTKESGTVGDEILQDIDTTTSTDATSSYNTEDLNDLNQ